MKKKKEVKEKVKSKRPIGRPTDYYPELCKEVIPLLAKGYSIEELGWELGTGYTTLYEWMNKYQEFANAIKRGRELSKGCWVRKGRLNVGNKDYNTGMYMIQMRNRFKWDSKDKNDENVIKHEDALKELE